MAAADCGGWAVLPPQTSCLRQSPSKPQAGSCPLTVLLRCLPCASLPCRLYLAEPVVKLPPPSTVSPPLPHPGEQSEGVGGACRSLGTLLAAASHAVA